MDSIDKSIIKLLENNGRMSHEEISKSLHISRPAIHQRVNKLENENIIKGYKSIVNWQKLGEPIRAFLYIKIHSFNFKETVNMILSLKVLNVSIEECHRLAGEWCLVLKIRVITPTDISNFIDELCKVQGIKETSTTFVLSTIMENGQME